MNSAPLRLLPLMFVLFGASLAGQDREQPGLGEERFLAAIRPEGTPRNLDHYRGRPLLIEVVSVPMTDAEEQRVRALRRALKGLTQAMRELQGVGPDPNFRTPRVYLRQV